MFFREKTSAEMKRYGVCSTYNYRVDISSKLEHACMRSIYLHIKQIWLNYQRHSFSSHLTFMDVFSCQKKS